MATYILRLIISDTVVAQIVVHRDTLSFRRRWYMWLEILNQLPSPIITIRAKWRTMNTKGHSIVTYQAIYKAIVSITSDFAQHSYMQS